VESTDIVSYLALHTSFVTAEQLKARKDIEATANNQFLNVWVRDVCDRKVAGKCFLTGQVRVTTDSFIRI